MLCCAARSRCAARASRSRGAPAPPASAPPAGVPPACAAGLRRLRSSAAPGPGFGLGRRSGVLGVPPPRVLALGTPSGAAARAPPPSRRPGGRGPQCPPRPPTAGPGALRASAPARVGRSNAAPCCPMHAVHGCAAHRAHRARLPVSAHGCRQRSHAPAARPRPGQSPAPAARGGFRRGGPYQRSTPVVRSRSWSIGAASRRRSCRSASCCRCGFRSKSRSKAALRASSCTRNSDPMREIWAEFGVSP